MIDLRLNLDGNNEMAREREGEGGRAKEKKIPNKTI